MHYSSVTRTPIGRKENWKTKTNEAKVCNEGAMPGCQQLAGDSRNCSLKSRMEPARGYPKLEQESKELSQITVGSLLVSDYVFVRISKLTLFDPLSSLNTFYNIYHSHSSGPNNI